jgi:hypothetical protein
MRADRTPKPASPKQLDANRLNAKKSTGPRTAAGRARSRMNALRHGLCARVVLLPGEDRSAYGAFAEQIVDELKPKGIVQQILAGRVAALAWSLSRLPDAADDLVKRGMKDRFDDWANRSGVTQSLWATALRRSRASRPAGTEPDPLFLHCPEDAQRELSRAYEAGNPPPPPLTPGGVIAEAVAGEHGFDAVLKLDEHERRLWSAFQSALRSLERRQKLDGCADDDADGDDNHPDDETDSVPEPTEPAACDTGFQPVPERAGAQGAPVAESTGDQHGLQTRVTEGQPDAREPANDSPARNEPDSSDDAAATAEAEGPPRPMDAAVASTSDGAPDAYTAGAERTHLSDASTPASPDETGLDPAPPPPN